MRLTEWWEQMKQTNVQKKKRITRGKFDGINAIANSSGIIAAAAMDQRRTLLDVIAKAKGSDATYAELSEFKTLVTKMLSPYASAVLLDPVYGLEAVQYRAKNVGVLLAYEETGYDTQKEGRIPRLLPQWSVQRLVEVGANAVKLLVYYDPDDATGWVNAMKHDFVKRVGAECLDCDVPFFLEVVAYSDNIGDEKSAAFAPFKPEKVRKYMEEFSKPKYRVDVLKVEVPVNVSYVEGLKANSGRQVIYSRQKALEFFREAAAAAQVPFIYLSAGVSNEVFLETLKLAIEAETPFSGVLCGRATWQDGIKEYTRGGSSALHNWLESQGVRNMEALNKILSEGAKPWWDFYGGKESIEIVDTKSSL